MKRVRGAPRRSPSDSRDPLQHEPHTHDSAEDSEPTITSGRNRRTGRARGRPGRVLVVPDASPLKQVVLLCVIPLTDGQTDAGNLLLGRGN